MGSLLVSCSEVWLASFYSAIKCNQGGKQHQSCCSHIYSCLQYILQPAFQALYILDVIVEVYLHTVAEYSIVDLITVCKLFAEVLSGVTEISPTKRYCSLSFVAVWLSHVNGKPKVNSHIVMHLNGSLSISLARRDSEPSHKWINANGALWLLYSETVCANRRKPYLMLASHLIYFLGTNISQYMDE